MITAELAQKRGLCPPQASLVDLSIELLGEAIGKRHFVQELERHARSHSRLSPPIERTSARLLGTTRAVSGQRGVKSGPKGVGLRRHFEKYLAARIP